ncbi:MAG: DUF262 domain-containing protein [Bacteroidetes bacterium]|nr:DUF262 domain-containing protein [Bacteroidota bacterium]
MPYQKEVRIIDTLQQIQRHEIVLPAAIQREFVWKPEQICTLFDSLMQGYPFGTFLYWKVKQENNKLYQFYDFVLDYHERDAPHCPRIGQIINRDIIAVLDGQQRLTALNIGLRGSLSKKLPYKRWSTNDAFPKSHLYLDLLWTPSENEGVDKRYRFEFLTDQQVKAQHGCWFPVREILNFEDGGPAITEWLENHILTGQSLTDAHKVCFRLFAVIRHLPVVAFYEESSQELDKVLQIFIRSNSGGTLLSYSDLLLSIAAAQWISDAREEIHQLVDDLNYIGAGFSFSKDWVLKAGLMLSDIGSVGFKVDNFNRENMRKFEKRWPEIKTALSHTVELVSSFGFNEKTLRADSALLPIAYYLYARKADAQYLTSDKYRDDRKSIRRWLIASFLKPSGIWGSGLDTLLTALRSEIKKHHTTFPLPQIEETMRSRGKTLEFNEDEIDDLTELRINDKRTFSLLSLMFTHLDLQQIFHIDHIFPKSRFTPIKLRKSQLSEDEIIQFKDYSDRLPNLQLLQGLKNIQKGATMPADWLRQFNNDPKRVQYSDIHLLGQVPESISDFKNFYEARRKLLRERIVNLLIKRQAIK